MPTHLEVNGISKDFKKAYASPEGQAKKLIRIYAESGGVSKLCWRKSLNDYSWDEISKISRAGMADKYFNLGDEKEAMVIWSFPSTRIRYVYRIVGFYHDTVSGSSEKAGITFMLKKHQFVTKMSYIDDPFVEYTQTKTHARVCEEYSRRLPEDLKRVIRPVIKQVVSLDGTAPNAPRSIKEKEFHLFSFSRAEIWGKEVYKDDAELAEGDIYEHFREKKNHYTYSENGFVSAFWTRTPAHYGSYFTAGSTDPMTSGCSRSNDVIYGFCV